MELRRVGILSPGDMGAAIGAVLHEHGIKVYTCLAGRSELSRLRAHEAGFLDTASLDEFVRRVGLVLTVLVPAEALGIAEQVAASMRRTGAQPVYADCNAVSPRTMQRIAALVTEAGAGCIDASIIGEPPRNGAVPRIYCSGPAVEPIEALNAFGLAVRRVGPEIGQASGLKMVYAASTKGATALWTELLVAARALGLSDALGAEFSLHGSAVAKQMLGSLPSMPRRARRWVGEMEEIAATFAEAGLTPRMLQGAADMYRLVSDSPLADQTSREPDPSLDLILDTLVQRAAGASPHA
jgi:3-hydroxyisobutyrate dehydrogenase-like beta-hydroxyacid dehydrogenase